MDKQERQNGTNRRNPIIAGTVGAQLKFWHEKPIPKTYSTIDTDLTWGNIETDIPLADLEDLR